MLLDSLRKCSLFLDLTDSELQKVHEIVHIRTVPAGGPIVEEGLEAISLFAIETGSVDIVKNSVDGALPRITQLFEGEIFGEIAFLDHATRSASVVAHTDATIIEIHYAALEKLVAEFPPLGLKLYKAMAVSLSKKTRRTTHDLVSLVCASRMAALGELTSGISHEVKTPLTTILLNADMLGRMLNSATPNVSQINERVGAIKSTVQRIVTIVDGLSGLAKNRAGDPIVVVSVKKMLDDMLVLFREKFKSHQVLLETTQVSSELNVKIRTVQISQVLINLLNNALDANEHLPIKNKWVRIEIQESEFQVEIAITDAGLGIEPALQDRIFQPFFTTKGNDIGTGLGLSISRGIVERHGGSLILDCASPNTRFVMRLPKP